MAQGRCWQFSVSGYGYQVHIYVHSDIIHQGMYVLYHKSLLFCIYQKNLNVLKKLPIIGLRLNMSFLK